MQLFSIAENNVEAISLPTFGKEYKAMIRIKDKETGNNYRYDLFTGKQVMIEKEYSTLSEEFLNNLKGLLESSITLGDNNVSFWYICIHRINEVNQNTEGWEDIDYKALSVPKFVNKKKPGRSSTKKTTTASK